MAENVCAELQLEPIGRLQAAWRGHDAGVVDQQMQGAMLLKFRGGKIVDRGKRSEIEECQLSMCARRIGFHACQGCFASSPVAAGEDDMSSFASELQSCVVADTAVRASDENTLACERWNVRCLPLLAHRYWTYYGGRKDANFFFLSLPLRYLCLPNNSSNERSRL